MIDQRLFRSGSDDLAETRLRGPGAWRERELVCDLGSRSSGLGREVWASREGDEHMAVL